MATQSSLPLPIATPEYSFTNESLTRRQLEHIIQDLQTEITLLKTMSESVPSKSIRRHQFLLMGVNQ